MASFQTIAEDLLMETGASRVMVGLRNAPGALAWVAEAVSHGAEQLRNVAPDEEFFAPATLQKLERENIVVVQDDPGHGEQVSPALLRHARAQILAPLTVGDRLAGLIAVQHANDPRRWESREIEAVRRVQGAIAATLEEQRGRKLAVTEEDLRDAGLQAILDRVREALRVQRCTLRQDVSASFAFPVTHESRADGVRSLRGDFTIVQSSQPVIQKLLAERKQVVQNDTRAASPDPLFHDMLKHYGDMRAQIVTPLFRDGKLAAVLSVHSLKELRDWTAEETSLARSGAQMLGLLIGATLA